MVKKKILLPLLAVLCTLSQQADASGFALIEQSVSSMGNAYAGGAAIAEDASTIFFNPAGITRLCGDQFVNGFHIVIPVADYKDEGSLLNPLLGNTTVFPVTPSNVNANATTALQGTNGHNAGEAALVGHSYYSAKLNNCWWIGLAITSPFGLVTDYDDNNWKGRYHATRSSLLTLDFNPVVAYKVNHCLSIGAGIRALYAHAKLSNRVDYGTITWLNVAGNGAAQAALNAVDFLPQEEDGHVRLKGNAWGFGGNVGVLYEPCFGTRIGFNWRSQIKLKIDGTEKFSGLPAFVADPSSAPAPLQPLFAAVQAAAATNSGANAEVTLPDLFQISVYHEINCCWAVMADFSWTRWKLLEKLIFHFDNPNQPDAITTLKWRNSNRYSLGVTYTPDCCWKFRTGIAYDETPIKTREFRTPRIPDEDRIWLTGGVGFEWGCLHYDIGYAHLFVRTPRVDKTDFTLDEDAVRGGLRGKYDAHTDIVSAQVVWGF